MSLVNHQVKLLGSYSYKIFDSGHNLKKEVKDVRNFITNSGLSAVSNYNLADCFRFCSLGSGTTQNSIIAGGTTGLSEPLSAYSYIGSRSNYNDVTTSAYATNGVGFIENQSGVSLVRAWTIPTGGNFFNSSYTFNEIMVSPGRPLNSSNLCGSQAGAQPTATDASIIADYYDENGPSICSAPYAFSRIITPISVNANDYLVLSYRLDVIYQTGVQQFVINIDKTVLPPTSASTNWSGLITGYYSLINPAINYINDGTSASSASPRVQKSTLYGNYQFSLEYGESFTPLFGCGLEPSLRPLSTVLPQTNLSGYLSTDNQQFLVNNFSGGAMTNPADWQPFNPNGFPPSSGLLTFIPNSSTQAGTQFTNIRTNLGQAVFPLTTNFTQVGTNPGDLTQLGNLEITKNPLANSPYIPSGRSRTCTFSNTFPGLLAANNDWTNLPVRSLVLAYTDGNYTTSYPFFDLIFAGIDGKGLAATGNFGGNPLAIQQSATNDYFYLEDGANLDLTYNLIWSSPCPSDVIGCT